jgi:hypothetical protein
MCYSPSIYIVSFNRLDRFKGFLQIYQLQTENDEEETWRDLVRQTRTKGSALLTLQLQSNHGFDRTLRLVSSRREDADTDDSNVTVP